MIEKVQRLVLNNRILDAKTKELVAKNQLFGYVYKAKMSEFKNKAEKLYSDTVV